MFASVRAFMFVFVRKKKQSNKNAKHSERVYGRSFTENNKKVMRKLQLCMLAPLGLAPKMRCPKILKKVRENVWLFPDLFFR